MKKAYVSHSIRGEYGPNATVEQMRQHCEIVKQFIDMLRVNMAHRKAQGESFAIQLNSGPMILPTDVEFYVPAEHEEFVQLAYAKKYMNEQQILDVDCSIIETCDAVFAFGPPELSRGMQIEIAFANEHGIPVYYMG